MPPLGPYQGFVPNAMDTWNWQNNTYGQSQPNAFSAQAAQNSYQQQELEQYEEDQRKKDEQKAAQSSQKDGGVNVDVKIPLPFRLGVITLPKPSSPKICLPNPVPKTNTDPSTNSSSTNTATNRPINFATNSSNITINTNAGNINTNLLSTNRITNGGRLTFTNSNGVTYSNR